MATSKVRVELLSDAGEAMSEAEAYVLIKPGLDEVTLSDMLEGCVEARQRPTERQQAQR